MRKQSKNYYYTKEKFISYASWKDGSAGFLLFPAVWFKTDVKPSFEVSLTQVFLGWGHRRFSFNLGVFKEVNLSAPVDWTLIAYDDFSKWLKKIKSIPYNKKNIERLFELEPWTKKIVIIGSLKNHYVRELILKTLNSLYESGLLSEKAKNSTDSLLSSEKLNFHSSTEDADISEDEQKSINNLSKLGGKIG